MTTTLPTVLISGASEELTARIEHLIRGQAELSLVKSVTPEEAVNENFKAKLIWIELESDPEGNMRLLEHLIKSHQNTFFVVSKEDLEPELVKRTMQVGALDFLDHKGWAAQIRSVVRRIMAKEFGSKPNPGSPMSGAARQPTRPSSWGQLNSLKVTVPPNSGFKRVEAGKPSGLPPIQSQSQSAPGAPPVARAPQAVPEPQVVEEVQEEQQYEEVEETIEYQAEDAEGSYAEGEVPEGGYAEGAYAEGEGAYAEGEIPEGGYAEGAYGESEGAYAEGEVPEGGYAEGAYAEDEGAYAEGEVPEGGYAEGAYAEDEGAYAEGEFPEDGYATTGDQQDYATEEFSSGESVQSTGPDERAQTPASPAQKGRWDELDSIISTGKPEEKKATSKWGDLGNIQAIKPAAKDGSPAPSSASKWSDLDALGSKPAATPESPTAKPANKWGDLDAIAGKGAATPSTGANKWGDLDNIGSKDSESTKTAPSANKWSDLDAIGSKSQGSEPATPSSVGNKWGDLDAISSGGAKSFDIDQPAADVTPGSKWGDLNSIAPPSAKESAEPAANKWGNLDGLGSKSGTPKTHTKSFIKPKAQPSDASIAAANKAKWGDLAATDNLSEGNTEAAPGGQKWGNLDAIGGGMAKSPQQLDAPSTTGGVGAESKWGGLNSIPTPKTAQDPAGNWGDLASIPTPKVGPEAPALVEGALPTKADTNETAQKWKAGMSSDISDGARQVGEMRDKLKAKKVPKVKVASEFLNIGVAVAILAGVCVLSVNFFPYPVPQDMTSTSK